MMAMLALVKPYLSTPMKMNTQNDRGKDVKKRCEEEEEEDDGR
jgi:hypothetical protein